ncbi:sel1 repeat family protein [Hymenobacter sp. BT175]|uniref:tetratricopeptide repeat protein n=1 Tax=Hymenobacter translucens TaxID=2886507 RepID=UPI001D0EFC86|nr:tetratricopeptide repeat protein [Hymenobacter translucens]MCC2545541.1 sel1 repeat family protein [Hymenobacter translucens]
MNDTARPKTRLLPRWPWLTAGLALVLALTAYFAYLPSPTPAEPVAVETTPVSYAAWPRDSVAAVGKALLTQKKYARALPYLWSAAWRGHAASQYRLGRMHQLGLGVKSDERLARALTRVAAEGGNASAQYYLGRHYQEGTAGVARDLTRARWWYGLAAEQGLIDAQYELGELYRLAPAGKGRNPERSMRLLQRAASQGHAGAQYRIGRLYQTGRGAGPADAGEAAYWYGLAARQGHDSAQYHLRHLEKRAEATR